MLIPTILAVLAAVAWVLFLAYQFHQLVESYHYSELRLSKTDNTYINRVKYSFRERFYIPRIVLLLIGSTLIVSGLSYVLSVGTLAIVGACV